MTHLFNKFGVSFRKVTILYSKLPVLRKLTVCKTEWPYVPTGTKSNIDDDDKKVNLPCR